MLPWSDCIRVPDRDGLVAMQGPDRIGYDPVPGPVATTDDIARPGHTDGLLMPVIFLWIKKRIAIAVDDDLRTGLAGAVRVMSPKVIGFPVRIYPLVVQIHLVGGNQDNHTGLFDPADAV